MTSAIIAKYFRDSIQGDYRKIVRQNNTSDLTNFYTLMNKSAFLALLGDLFYKKEDKHWIDVFKRLFEDDKGFIFWSNLDKRSNAKMFMNYYVKDMGTSLSKKEKDQYFFAASCWLRFFDDQAQDLTSDWDNCPFCSAQLVGNECKTPNCIPSQVKRDAAFISLNQLLESNTVIPTYPDYWKAIKIDSEFHQIKTQIEVKQENLKEQVSQQEKSERKDTLARGNDVIFALTNILQTNTGVDEEELLNVKNKLDTNQYVKRALMLKGKDCTSFQSNVTSLKKLIAEKEQMLEMLQQEQAIQGQFKDSYDQLYKKYIIEIETYINKTHEQGNLETKDIPTFESLYFESIDLRNAVKKDIENQIGKDTQNLISRFDQIRISAYALLVSSFEKYARISNQNWIQKIQNSNPEELLSKEYLSDYDQDSMIGKIKKYSPEVYEELSRSFHDALDILSQQEMKAKEVEFNVIYRKLSILVEKEQTYYERSEKAKKLAKVNGSLKTLSKIEHSINHYSNILGYFEILKKLKDQLSETVFNFYSQYANRMYVEVIEFTSDTSKYRQKKNECEEFRRLFKMLTKQTDLYKNVDFDLSELEALLHSRAHQKGLYQWEIQAKREYNERVKKIKLYSIIGSISLSIIVFIGWLGFFPYMVNGIKFDIENDSVTVTGVKAHLTSLSIPSQVRKPWAFHKLTVNKIANKALMNNTRITYLKLPSTITHIGDQAFYNSSLSILIIDTLTPPNMGQNVFGDQSPERIFVLENTYSLYATDLIWSNQMESIFPYQSDITTNHTIILDPDEGSKPNGTSNCPTGCYYVFLTPDDTLESITSSKFGFIFVGWEDVEGDLVDTNQNISQSMRLKAVWAPIDSWIYFDVGDYPTDFEPVASAYSYVVGTLPVLEKSGYEFEGWFTNTQYSEKVDSSTTVTWVDDITLYPKWKAITYSVNLDYNHADTKNGPSSLSVHMGEPINTLPIPVKTGFTFLGWFESLNSNALQVTEATIYLKAANSTIYAKWQKTITLVNNNGSPNENIDREYLSKLGSLPTPVKSNYQFIGWFDNIQGGTLHNSEHTIDENMPNTLYAKWESSLYFDYQDADENIDVNYIDVWFLNDVGLLPTPTKTGYQFDGWYTLEGGMGTKIESNTTFDFENLNTVYAKWITTIQFDYQGATSNNLVTNMQVIYQRPISVVLPTPMKSGNNVFGGWYTEVGGQGSKVEQTQIYEYQGGITLYAKWTTHVQFNYQNATGGNSTNFKEVVFNQMAGLLPIPEKLGFSFEGWYTSVGGEGTKIETHTVIDFSNETILFAKWMTTIYFDYQGADAGISFNDKQVIYNKPIGNLPAPIKTGVQFFGWTDNNVQIHPETVYTMDEPITLTALWISVLIFNYQLYDNATDAQGTNIVTSMPIKNGDIIFNLPEPTKIGFVFDGWYTNIAGEGIQYSNSDVYTKTVNTILYAKWLTNIYLEYEGADDVIIESIDIIFNAPIPTLPTPLKTGGNLFLGWYTQSGGEGSLFSDEGNYESRSGNITLYATWQSHIVFDYQNADGSTEISQINVIYNGKVNTLPEPTKSGGNIFGGWFTEIAGEGIQIATDNLFLLNGATTVYAKWVNQVQLNYEDATDNNTVSSIDIVYNKVVDINIIPIKIGYIFDGWYTDVTGMGIKYDSSIVYNVSEGLIAYAKWVKEIHLDYQGANSLIEVESIDTIYKTAVGVLPTPTKSENTFLGWYTEPGASGVLYTESTIINDSTLTLYAAWQTTIYFNYQGATGNNSVIEMQIIYHTPIVNLPSPTKTGGNTFVGWFTSNSIQAEKVENNSLFNFDNEITLFAVWSNFIQFNYQGATGNHSVVYQTVYYQMAIGSLPNPTKTGYQFNGWKSSDNVVFDSNTIYTSSESLTLIAVWTPIVYTITYQMAGGTNNINNPVSYTIESPTINILNPTRAGFTFNNWTGGNQIISGTIGNKTFTANWTVITYNITYVLNQGTNHVNNPSTYTVQSNTINIQTPTRTGYIFDYWEEGNQIVAGSTGNKTFTAIWTPISYTVVYNTDGGSAVNTTHNAIYNQSFTITSTTPTKNNNEFRGWSLVKGSSSAQYASGAIVSNLTTVNGTTVTLYAVWEENPCIIEGTQILLADGSTVLVENLNIGDMVMIWNFETGRYDISPIVFVEENPYNDYLVMNLVFSDNTVLSIVYEHALYSTTLKQFVFMNEQTVESFIGYKFLKASVNSEGNANFELNDEVAYNEVTLVSVIYEVRNLRNYSVLSAVHINHFANGMLTAAGAIQGLLNIFEVNDDHAYDLDLMQEDIETYGLFTYEEFADYATYEQFIIFNGAVLKISIGKGLMSMDDLLRLIHTYLDSDSYEHI